MLTSSQLFLQLSPVAVAYFLPLSVVVMMVELLVRELC